jgi:hypothetical protein
MPTYLLTVETCHATARGLRVHPSLRADDLSRRPAVARMAPGARIALVHPDGTTRLTGLETYGLPRWQDTGDLYMIGPAPAPELYLVLPRHLSPGDVPFGTEVWLLPEGDAR